jgi:hypothetical protein
MDFDLTTLREADQRAFIQTVTNPQTQITYHKLDLQLEINVTQSAADVNLWILGNAGSGVHLLSETNIPFTSLK